MKATVIDSSVLGGQGGIGSKILTVANPAPPQGPAGGDQSHPLTINPGKLNANPPKAAPTGSDGTLSTEYGNFTKTVQGTDLGGATLGSKPK